MFAVSKEETLLKAILNIYNGTMLFHHFTPSLAFTVISISIEYAYSLDLLIAAHRLYRLTLRNSTVSSTARQQ